MMKIVCLSDTHNCNEQITVPDGDILIHAAYGPMYDDKYYFTGKPCKNGHICKRFKSNRWCYLCAITKLKEKNEKLKKERKLRKSQTPKEKAKAKGNHKFKGQKCKRCKNSVRYVADARCIKCATLKNKSWQTQNRRQRSFNQSKREAKKLKATPPWADLEAIRKIYINCPDGYTVDHIIPLQGRNICGLHVDYNLQYLTPIENSRKSNKLICE